MRELTAQPEATEESARPKKGRGNAIVTYETISEISLRIGQVDEKMNYMLRERTRQEQQHSDHETRIRTMEATVTGFIAGFNATTSASATTKTDLKWVWAAVIAAASLAVNIFALYHK